MKSESFKERAPLGYLIQEVARLMKRRFEDEARAHGITLPQWKTLAQIAESEGVTQAALAAGTDIDPMTMSGILDRLEKRGLIERLPDPNDSRAKLAQLTPDGSDLLRAARAVGIAMYEATLDGVSEDDRQVVISSLALMRDNLSGPTADQKESA